MKPLISIVISSYNDSEIIKPYHKVITDVLEGQETYGWEIIYVDDGSVDQSVQVLKEMAAANPKISFIELAQNFGQQKAFFAGMKKAQGDVVIILDGDFQYNPSCILSLADKLLEGFDIVSGIRVSRKDPILMKLTSKIGQYFIRRVFKTAVTDFGSVKAFSRFLVQQILKYETYCITVHGMSYALSNRHTEIPVEHLPRPVGRSKWSTLKRVHLLFDIFLGFSDFHMITLTKIGIRTSLLGFLTLSVLLYLYLAHRIFFFHTFTAVTALSLMGCGVLITLFSFGLSFLLRIYRMLLWKNDITVIRKIYGNEN